MSTTDNPWKKRSNRKEFMPPSRALYAERGEEIKPESAQRERIESSFWFLTKCLTCGAVNDKAEDSSRGWRFYSTPGQRVLYTCGKCPVLPDAKEGYEH